MCLNANPDNTFLSMWRRLIRNPADFLSPYPELSPWAKKPAFSSFSFGMGSLEALLLSPFSWEHEVQKQTHIHFASLCSCFAGDFQLIPYVSVDQLLVSRKWQTCLAAVLSCLMQTEDLSDQLRVLKGINSVAKKLC